MIVVADASPLNYLIQMGLDRLLAEEYETVLIPSAVAKELSHSRAPLAVRSWMTVPPAWLRTVEVTLFDRSLPGDLGRGEFEAISLALQLNLTVLMDDLWGRKEAEIRRLKTAGTLAVLLEGALRGRLDLAAALVELAALGFRMSDEIAKKTLERYETRKNGPVY